MTNNNNHSDSTHNKWKHPWLEFFWICSGANRDILRQCPTEYSKYFGIGGTIFFTAAMAMLSGGYAFFTIFDSLWLAILFGIFWGLLIFNLDRLIVNTMYSDGKHTIGGGELLAATPRLIIALFLGIIISHPLEMKIFEDEIRVEIEDLKEQRIVEYQAGDYAKIEELESRKEKLFQKIQEIQANPTTYGDNIRTGNREIDEKMELRENKVNEYNQVSHSIETLKSQISRTTDSATLRKLNTQLSAKSREQSKLRSEISELTEIVSSLSDNLKDLSEKSAKQRDDLIKSLQSDISSIDKDINDIKNKINNSGYTELINKEFNGFQAHMRAFSSIKQKDKSTRIVSFFITLMFIIIEICPTILKMMMAFGPYDDLHDAEMKAKRAYAIKRVSIMNDETNTQIELSVQKNKAKLEAELAANTVLMSRIAAVQVELLETAIEEWRKEELEKIKKNPSQYIQLNTKVEKNEC